MPDGGKFRLLFVTSTALNASTTVMDSYNGIIRDSVAAGHTDIRPYSHLFNALGSTALVDAIDNTKTTHTTTDMGVPIYYLNGAKVADNYSDFYDGTWDSHDPTNELGTELQRHGCVDGFTKQRHEAWQSAGKPDQQNRSDGKPDLQRFR